jgi:hypothetical protein
MELAYCTKLVNEIFDSVQLVGNYYNFYRFLLKNCKNAIL